MWFNSVYFSPYHTAPLEEVLAKSQKKMTLQPPFHWSNKPKSPTLATTPAILLLENLQKSLSMSFEVRIFALFETT